MEGMRMFVKANQKSLEQMVFAALANGADERNIKRILKALAKEPKRNVFPKETQQNEQLGDVRKRKGRTRRASRQGGGGAC
jgi:hypothetical protein